MADKSCLACGEVATEDYPVLGNGFHHGCLPCQSCGKVLSSSFLELPDPVTGLHYCCTKCMICGRYKKGWEYIDVDTYVHRTCRKCIHCGLRKDRNGECVLQNGIHQICLRCIKCLQRYTYEKGYPDEKTFLHSSCH